MSKTQTTQTNSTTATSTPRMAPEREAFLRAREAYDAAIAMRQAALTALGSQMDFETEKFRLALRAYEEWESQFPTDERGLHILPEGN